MIMTDDMIDVNITEQYLDILIVDSLVENTCGATKVVDSGSRKTKIVQTVSASEFGTKFASRINGAIIKLDKI